MAFDFLEPERVYLNWVYSVQSVIFLLFYFKGVTLRTLGGF